ncbi:RNA polymerase recycling motor HelD [Paenibacillus alkalitolerans]|uniref:RNA polymerase recycling motor HelD n=1 Tax=Paenibacillus alkalitolerans TaxID=2799335 RepID=UPI0018F52EFB|nr:RNA polymerase recycling motor HelD [Paenibacillus alkalitolerans]
MSVTEKDWLEEQERIDRVMSEIGSRIEVLGQHAGEKKSEIVDIRKNFWDDVTFNPRDEMESYFNIKQQADVLAERERGYEHARKQLAVLARLKQSPYFGRIDFVEDGEKTAERIYVGVASLLDEDEIQFLVYDWRAPVSSLYYDYAPGPALYDTPGGEISGVMNLKRQYIIRDGVLNSMFDTGVTIGDELLQEVLGKQADTQMKTIVATIQREQNRIIRNERSRLLIVQGAAGSGKTSAALQRVAYLLYRYRDTLNAQQIVLFSPNPIFNSYVSTVLPELGEENMQQTTYQEYVVFRIGGALGVGDPFDQMEYALTAMSEPGYAARMEGIRYKASADFLSVIERYAFALREEGMIFKDVTFRGDILVSADRIKAEFYTYDASMRIPNRLKLVTEWLRKELDACERAEREKSWVEEEIELLEEEEYLWAHWEVQRNKRDAGDSFDEFERERDLLAAKVVEAEFKTVRSLVKRLQFIDFPAIYRQLFKDPEFAARLLDGAVGLPEAWSEICAQTLEALDRAELAYEDATPYLYLQESIEGFRSNHSVRHVFIDEAQDYSPFQFALIHRLFPRSKMTVLGDLNQAIYPHPAAFESMYSLFPDEPAETFVLTRTYRSTRQIVEFTSRMIPGGEGMIEPFNREGAAPTVTQASGYADLVKKVARCATSLVAAGHRTVGVICKTAAESREAYEELRRAGLEVSLIGKNSATFQSGVSVIPSYLAKGVEFDAVIIYNASQERYRRESERKLLYTACTRAMHELHVFYVGDMSMFLS